MGGRLLQALKTAIAFVWGLVRYGLSSFALLANLLPLTPGGIGVGEVALDRFLAHRGVAALVSLPGLLLRVATGLSRRGSQCR